MSATIDLTVRGRPAPAAAPPPAATPAPAAALPPPSAPAPDLVGYKMSYEEYQSILGPSPVAATSTITPAAPAPRPPPRPAVPVKISDKVRSQLLDLISRPVMDEREFIDYTKKSKKGEDAELPIGTQKELLIALRSIFLPDRRSPNREKLQEAAINTAFEYWNNHLSSTTGKGKIGDFSNKEFADEIIRAINPSAALGGRRTTQRRRR